MTKWQEEQEMIHFIICMKGIERDFLDIPYSFDEYYWSLKAMNVCW